MVVWELNGISHRWCLGKGPAQRKSEHSEKWRLPSLIGVTPRLSSESTWSRLLWHCLPTTPSTWGCLVSAGCLTMPSGSWKGPLAWAWPYDSGSSFLSSDQRWGVGSPRAVGGHGSHSAEKAGPQAEITADTGNAGGRGGHLSPGGSCSPGLAAFLPPAGAAQPACLNAYEPGNSFVVQVASSCQVTKRALTQ